MKKKITISVIKADVGGFVGHSGIHHGFIEEALEHMDAAQHQGLLLDSHVTACGDDLQLIMTHERGIDNEEIHKLAWDVFLACTEVA